MRQTHSVKSIVVGSLLLVALLLVGCHSGSKDVGPLGGKRVGLSDTQLLGDMDNNGEPSVGDAIMILRIVVGLADDDPCADTNGNGSTDVGDAIKVLRCVVGLDDWPLGECRPAPTGTLSGIHSVTDFVVGGDERIACISDVTVQCETATISGEIYGVDGSAFGGDGVSVTIEAQGDVVLTGAMYGGDGAAGSLMTNSGQGGNGGSVTINSANGDITIGVEVESSASAPDPYLGAGDAGVGADDLSTAVPGAGGQGGSVSVSCRNGLLTMYPRLGLIHIGNGGDGGTGHIPADSEAEPSEPTDYTPDGGDSGTFAMQSQDFAGLEEQDGAIVIDPPEMLTGGNGGDGGGIWIHLEVGSDPTESGSTAAGASSPRTAGGGSSRNSVDISQGSDGVTWLQASGDGGNAICPGEPGAGGMYFSESVTDGDTSVGFRGGQGGDLGFGSIEDDSGVTSVAMYPMDLYKGGWGGTVYVRGCNRVTPAACQDGKPGIVVRGAGGPGGRVIEDDIPANWLGRMNIVGGTGGDGTAVGGRGQDGGDCCGSPKGQGGVGGRGGDAYATGGKGGDQVAGTGGTGGNASATGGQGGDGGNGTTPGEGGETAAAVVATAGQPGAGSPPGDEGNRYTYWQQRGNMGSYCSTAAEIGVVTSDSPQRTIYGYNNFYTSGSSTLQVESDFSLGGTDFPVVAWVGQSMIFSPDNSRLWVGNELGGMCLYRNPLTTNGDRAPDLQLHIDGTQWYSIWYEAQADTLYATTMNTEFIHAWDNASEGTANRVPDRSIEVPGYHGQGYLTGAPGSGVLFMATHLYTYERMLVFHNAAQLDGLHAADNYWVPQDFIAVNGHALSWDQARDLLYVGVPNLNQVHVYAEASTVDGVEAVTVPDRIITIDYPGMAVGDWISGVIIMPDQDILVVSMYQGQTMVFTGASFLQGTPEPAKREQLGTTALGLGVFKQ
jgi:hypothetical protein